MAKIEVAAAGSNLFLQLSFVFGLNVQVAGRRAVADEGDAEQNEL
jgi:hypothetical protein